MKIGVFNDSKPWLGADLNLADFEHVNPGYKDSAHKDLVSKLAKVLQYYQIPKVNATIWSNCILCVKSFDKFIEMPKKSCLSSWRVETSLADELCSDGLNLF